MTPNEKKAVARLVRHMQQLQRWIKEPTNDLATDNEVITLLSLLWAPTRNCAANQVLPSKHVIEDLVALMRGREPRTSGYIDKKDVARIIRKLADEKSFHSPLPGVYLNKGYQEMSDADLYLNGRWNYRPTTLVSLLRDLHRNPEMIEGY